MEGNTLNTATSEDVPHGGGPKRHRVEEIEVMDERSTNVLDKVIQKGDIVTNT